MLSSLFLSACGDSRPRVAAKIPVPPAYRLTCKAEPRVPADTTDATTAAFIVALADAGADCRSAVAWLKDWSDSLNK